MTERLKFWSTILASSQSTECSFTDSLNNSFQLVNISCVGCNLIGPLLEFIGSLKSLTTPLNLSYSRLSCEISANLTTSQKLQLNGDQIVCLVPKILANMELRIVAHGSSIAGSPQSTPCVSTMPIGILVTENQTPKAKSGQLDIATTFFRYFGIFTAVVLLVVHGKFFWNIVEAKNTVALGSTVPHVLLFGNSMMWFIYGTVYPFSNQMVVMNGIVGATLLMFIIIYAS
ncbi:hypothetical protein ACFE04_030868 [Oxalis oulophora]